MKIVLIEGALFIFNLTIAIVSKTPVTIFMAGFTCGMFLLTVINYIGGKRNDY